jgi:light-regulated signal transduction histidine kinase (bacteriophytochrome)
VARRLYSRLLCGFGCCFLSYADGQNIVPTALDGSTSLAHDLKESLYLVTASLDLLVARHAHALSPPARELVELAHEGAMGSQRLVAATVAPGVGGLLSLVDVDADAALDAALKPLTGLVATTGARVARGKLPRVRADEIALTRVFQNLVANAVRHARHAHPEVRISAERDASGWVFAVADDGPGIAPRDRWNIFAGVSRADGHGLGLPISLSLVAAMHGRLWVESPSGKGSTFCFSLEPVE